MMDSTEIRSVVEEVMNRLRDTNGKTPASPAPAMAKPTRDGNGVFAEAEKAVEAAHAAYGELSGRGLAGREKIVQVVKRLCHDKAEEWGKLEFEETGIGRLEHKVAKLTGIPQIPGTEWLSPHGMSGDHGITMEENCPFGLVGAITPVTHSIPTIACNIVSMVAAGNTVVFNAHPGGAKCAAAAIRAFNEAIRHEVGIDNVVTIVESPTLESFETISRDPRVRLLCVTGGPGIVEAAMRSGKRAICAGPGNPPVVVDETADLRKAAEAIVVGGGFDNDLLCIGEKEVFVVKSVYKDFLRAFEEAGARRLNDGQLERLTKAAFTYKEDDGGCSHPVVNRQYVGADAAVLAREAGLDLPASTPVLYAETGPDHAFVLEEQMMPMIPVVPVADVDEGIRFACKAEHGFGHSSMIHSMNVGNMSKMAKRLETTLFVKNGPCIAGLGTGGEGYASFSIATTTGEGITTPDTFTRKRRCVLVDNLSLM